MRQWLGIRNLDGSSLVLLVFLKEEGKRKCRSLGSQRYRKRGAFETEKWGRELGATFERMCWSGRVQGVKSECGSPEQPGYSEVPLAAPVAHDNEGEGEKRKSLT